MHKDLIIPENTKVLEVLDRFDHNDTPIFILKSERRGIVGYILDMVLRSVALDFRNLIKPVATFTLNNFYLIDQKEKSYSGIDLKNYSLVIETYGTSLEKFYGPILNRGVNNDISTVPVVIMAGGQGKRLRPLTNIIPKPLIPIADKTVLEVIIERFYQYGMREFYLTLNYKAKFIKAYFSELAPAYNLHYIEEDKPLGTAGALRFLRNVVNKPFFVSNCDTLIDTKYQKIYDFHLHNKFDLTIVGAIQRIKIPFGICEVKRDFTLIEMREKPESYHIINTGVYVVNPRVLDIIPHNKFYDITDFISDIKKVGGRIGVYPISEKSWINLGSLSDFQKNMDKLL